jgi:hypothetical protein
VTPRFALSVAVLVAATGCSSPSEAVDSAVRKTIQEGSAHVVITGETTGGDQSITITGEGDFDYARLQGRANFDFSELPSANGEPLGEQGRGELVFDGSTYYMNLPFLSQLSPQLEGWVKFDTEKLSGTTGRLGQLGQNDPSQVLSYLNGATDVTVSGDEDVDGFPTTRYDLTIDYHDAKAEAPAKLEAAFDTIVSELGIERAPASVWVDENDFVRRMSYEWTIELDGSAGPGGKTTQNVELTFSDFGEEVSVELPPPDETVDFNELLEG